MEFPAVVALITVIIAIFSFISLYLVKPAKEVAEAAKLSAEAAKLKAEKIKDELSAYKLHVAETFVTDTALDKHFERIESQIGELKQLIKR